MVLQQQVRVRVSVVPNIFMISLAFVRNSIPMVTMAQCVGQQGSEPVGPGSSPCRTNYFDDFTDICKKIHSNGYHGTVGRTTGFWSGRYGFESQSSPTFLFFTTENLDSPSLLSPLIHKLFRSWKSSETQHTRVPLRNFSVLRDKKCFHRKSWFSPLRHKTFRCPKLSKTQKGSCSKFFGTMRQNFSNGKSWYRLAEITEISGGLDVWKLKSKQ